MTRVIWVLLLVSCCYWLTRAGLFLRLFCGHAAEHVRIHLLHHVGMLLHHLLHLCCKGCQFIAHCDSER